MKILRVSGPFLIVLLVLLPILLWLPQANTQSNTTIFRSLGQLTAIIGTVLLCIEYLLAARIKWLENLFLGLNRMYVIHALLGSIGFALILLHPFFLTLSFSSISILAAASFLTPSFENIPVLFGMAALILMTVLIILTIYVKLEYDLWKSTHRWLGFALLLFSIHAFLENSTFAPSKLLEIYMYAMYLIGICSFLYKQFSKQLGINITKYVVSDVNVLQDVVEFDMEPVKEKLHYKPGQFVFIEFNRKGLAKQSHPFSIVSSPNEEKLSFAVRSLGDYTETLKLLSSGTSATVEGPFGRFTYSTYPNKNQIWIAGGIGVTPFMSMLKSLTPEMDMNICFIYSVKKKEEALYLEEINKVVENLPNCKFELYIATERGMLTAKVVRELADFVDVADIFICGPPPMMQALKTQFVKLGVKSKKVHTEEFSLN